MLRVRFLYFGGFEVRCPSRVIARSGSGTPVLCHREERRGNLMRDFTGDYHGPCGLSQ